MPPFRKEYAAAVRFLGEAFAKEPKLAEDLQAGHRYDAACAAALAGCGQGEDVGNLDDKKKAGLRRQALDWLRADLQEWRGQLHEKPEIAPFAFRTLEHWLEDPDFGGVRGSLAIAKLPEAERQPWQDLWKEVADLLKLAKEKAAQKKK